MAANSFLTRRNVENREQFLNLLNDLVVTSNTNDWENNDTESYLRALGSWLNDSDGFYKNLKIELDTREPSWQLFADMIIAATIYE